MLCVDPERGGLEENDAIKIRLAGQEPYGRWLEDNLQSLEAGEPCDLEMPDLVARQAAFGYTKEEFTYVLRPMATQGKEPIFSMGDDTALSVLAQPPRLLYTYFKQRFAQVTNPPIDHLRERLVMSLRSYLGAPAPLLSGGPQSARLVQLDSFLLYPSGLDAVRALDAPFTSRELDATFPVTEGASGLRAACERLAEDAESATRLGANPRLARRRSRSPPLDAARPTRPNQPGGRDRRSPRGPPRCLPAWLWSAGDLPATRHGIDQSAGIGRPSERGGG
jgi:Glutamate synthase central domain